MATDRLGLCLCIEGNQASQYANYNFNSMCKFNGAYLGASEDGIFTLEDGDLDDTAEIEAFFELATTDFGIANQKRLRSVYLGYEADGDLMMTVEDDEGGERRYSVEPNHLDNKENTTKIDIGRDGKGRHWTFRIDNVNGSDFSIDSIEAIPTILGKRPSTS